MNWLVIVKPRVACMYGKRLHSFEMFTFVTHAFHATNVSNIQCKSIFNDSCISANKMMPTMNREMFPWFIQPRHVVHFQSLDGVIQAADGILWNITSLRALTYYRRHATVSDFFFTEMSPIANPKRWSLKWSPLSGNRQTALQHISRKACNNSRDCDPFTNLDKL